MSLASNLTNLATRIATEFKTIRSLITGSGTGTLAGLTTTDKTSVVGAINELDAALDAAAASGGATNLDQLTDVTVTAPAAGHILRHNGSGQFVNVDGATIYQPLDTDLTAIAALTTTAYGRAFLSLADQAALMGLIPAATEAVVGSLRLATQTETNTGTNDATAVTPLKLQTRLAAYAQPLDTDLTAIAALTTTTYGRAFLALADQAALMGLVPAATTTVQGKVSLATTAENQTGTDTTKASTPAGVKAAIDQRIDNNTALGSSTTNAPSQAAVKAYADALIGANDAMVFRGVIDASTNPNYPAANRGDTYKISVAGRIGGASGPVVEVGDLLIATADGLAAGTHATVGASWNITQTNIDGAVTGPASSVSGNLASFSGTTGKVVADSGLSVDTDGTLAANSDTRLATQRAVKTYAQPLDTELTALAGLVSAADRLPYFTGSGAASLATFTAFGRSLVDDADATTARATLGLGTAATAAATSFQAADTDLTAIAALVSAADTAPYATGAGTWALYTLTAFGRTLAGSADAAAARGTLSVYSQAEVGDPNTDFVSTFNTGLA